jgi:hypothetical protein
LIGRQSDGMTISVMETLPIVIPEPSRVALAFS